MLTRDITFPTRAVSACRLHVPAGHRTTDPMAQKARLRIGTNLRCLGVHVDVSFDTRRSADAPKSQGAPDVPFSVPSLPEKAVICGVVICVLVLRRHLSKASQAVSRDASQAVSRDNCYLKAFFEMSPL